MISVRLDKGIEERLCLLAERTGRSKSYHVREALREFLEDREDYFLAVEVLEEGGERFSLEEVKKTLDLES